MQPRALTRQTAARIRALRRESERARKAGNIRAYLIAWHRATLLDPATKWYELVRLGQLLNLRGMRKRSVDCFRRAMAMPGHKIPPMRFTPGKAPDGTPGSAPGTLVIGFTVFNGVMSGMRFPFWRSSGLDRYDRIELWDSRFQFFLGGMPPLADNYEELLALLKREVAKRAPRRLILAGSSGSGMAALLYGHALGADAVYAFSPSLCADLPKVAELEPETAFLLRGMLLELTELPLPRNLLDLREVLRTDNGKSRYFIHYGSENEFDTLRVRQLEGYPGVTLFPHPTEQHMVASWLGKAGKLRDLVAAGLERPGRGAA